MGTIRRSSQQQTGGRPFTAVSYLCALAAALLLCGAIGPGKLWRRSGIRKVYRPYYVLELPLPREAAAQGPLAVPGEELPPVHQKLMKQKRKETPEEYAGWLRDYPWEGEHLTARLDGTEYEIYFVPAAPGEITRVPIPVGYEYTVSGNGADGFIVTAGKAKR